MIAHDGNDGAGFWWANNRNTFTRNVAVECDGYGFRLEAPGPEDGPPGVGGVRPGPFVRFEGNEAHAQRRYGVNLGAPAVDGPSDLVNANGPDSNHPMVVRRLRIWDCHWGFTPAAPGLLVDGLDLAHCDYAVYKANFDRHAYRGLSIFQCGKRFAEIHGTPPDPAAFPGPLDPVDDHAPVSVITGVEPVGEGRLRVSGSASDDGPIKAVRVNGVEARPIGPRLLALGGDARAARKRGGRPDRDRRGCRRPRRADPARPEAGRAPTGFRSRPRPSTDASDGCSSWREESMNHRSLFGSKPARRAVILGALVIATNLLTPGRASAQGWPGYAHDPQHSCLDLGASQLPQKIRWKTSVDQSIAQGGGGTIYIHYGTPVITRLNTVVAPIKTTGGGNYEVSAFSGATGVKLWTASSNYTLPAHDWTPIFGITLTLKDKAVAYPGAGGTVYLRTLPDIPVGSTTQYAFFNGHPSNNLYGLNPSAFNSAIQICTPISSDAASNLYFGYVSSGAALPGFPNGIPSGLAKISATGVGSFIPAKDWYVNNSLVMHGIVGDPAISKVAYNCAPSFSADGSTVYVAVNSGSGRGYLAAVSTEVLAPKSAALLYDPSYPPGTTTAYVDDDGSATPTVGPDGDVYYGVLSASVSGNHYRGWLLHFDGPRSRSRSCPTPSAGMTRRRSCRPSLVPSYSGPSAYLLLTKYNNYADGGTGGTGVNQVAVVDPNVPMVDPISGVTVMQKVIAVTGDHARSPTSSTAGIRTRSASGASTPRRSTRSTSAR